MFAFLVLLLCSCNSPVVDASTRSAEVIIPPTASGIQYARGRGAEEAAYTLREEYPATEFLREIEKQLEALGWVAGEELYDNPGIATGQAGGWSSYSDPSVTPATEVRQWIGEWKNVAGDVITYSLRFPQPNSDLLSVSIHRRSKSSQ